MNELHVTYSELKETTGRMLCLVRNTVGGNEKLTLRKAFCEDLGVIELDWDSFLEEYEKEFNCSLEGLEYENYFKRKMALGDYLLFPVRIFALPLLLVPKRHLRRINKFLYPNRELGEKLTIGDLVLSAIAKKFVKREQVRIIIKPGQGTGSVVLNIA